MHTHTLALLPSRLGLRFAPMGDTTPNIGVEDGAHAVARALSADSLEKVLQFHQFEMAFPAPEQVEKEAYLAHVFEVYTAATAQLLEQWEDGTRLVSLGGDHSVSYISFSAVLERFGSDTTGIIMFDSHADLHSPASSHTGNFHGMWLRTFFDGFEAFSLPNKTITHPQLCFVGNLLLEQEELEYLEKNRCTVYNSQQATQNTAEAVAQWAAQYEHLHISFDIDVFSQSISPATGTPNKNGFTLQQVQVFLRALRSHPSFSLDIVEFNPKKKGAEQSLELIGEVFFELV